ncbi:hypothetical protein UG55_10533 [Frankia sp. EI5c]|uniref:hypothetical protein n=1 Tax=Frankia sp. EI5c TaxID=683316 RepID=UPI0007C3BB48|nr:hypothetical protein [Frankia sp. EI5c]OAA21826.1 hypothetical protein UG55_10533 [Frankia sp. EI5c]
MATTAPTTQDAPPSLTLAALLAFGVLLFLACGIILYRLARWIIFSKTSRLLMIYALITMAVLLGITESQAGSISDVVDQISRKVDAALAAESGSQ